MAKKESMKDIVRIMGNYITQKCLNPGHIMFLHHHSIYFCLFDDAIYVSRFIEGRLKIVHGIPLFMIHPKEKKSIIQKISAQKRSVKIEDRPHLDLVVDNTIGREKKTQDQEG